MEKYPSPETSKPTIDIAPYVVKLVDALYLSQDVDALHNLRGMVSELIFSGIEDAQSDFVVLSEYVDEAIIALEKKSDDDPRQSMIRQLIDKDLAEHPCDSNEPASINANEDRNAL